jgi:peptidyl-prolyl cis-trans isomerase C
MSRAVQSARLLAGVSAGVLVLALQPGCSKPAPREDDLVARVGTREIRRPEFEAAMKSRAVGNDSGQKTALLEELLDHAALVEAAKAAGLDKSPEMRRAWENLLVMKLREVQLEPRLTNAEPKADQVESYYASHRAQYVEPAMRRGAILFAEATPKMPAEARARLKRRLVEAREKAASITTTGTLRGFGPLAAEYSDDQASRYRGGDIGWIQAGKADARFDPPVIETLFALGRPDEVSEVIETARGFYLLKLTEIREERVKTLDSVRAAIRHQLLLESQKQLSTGWKQAARAAVPTEIFPDALERIRGSDPAPSAAEPPAIH